MNSKKTKLATFWVALSALPFVDVEAATYSLANESGDFKSRMTAAVNKAGAGDTILVDKNYTVGGWYTLTKAGLTIKGDHTLTATRAHVMKIRANNTTVKELTFVNGTQTVKIDGGGTRSNLTFSGIEIRGSGYAGLMVNDTNIDRLTITDSKFAKAFGILMEDSNRFTNVRIKGNIFLPGLDGNGHEISLDCAENTASLNHSNIRIENNVFYKTQAFNVALANMQASLLVSNTMYGGSNSYSQCVHIEDRTANTYIKNNTMWNTGDGNASHAVLAYATDRSGRGRGDLLTVEQKKNEYAPGNVTLEKNTIHGAGSNGVQVVYLKPNAKVRFYGSNVINSDDQAVKKSGNVATSQLAINDGSKLKGQFWSALKNLSPGARSSYVNW